MYQVRTASESVFLLTVSGKNSARNFFLLTEPGKTSARIVIAVPVSTIGFLPTLSGKNIARAVFLLTENKVKYKYPISIFGECVPVGIGRGVRQVRRLLRLLYRSRHFFFIHVDETSHWMYSQLVSLNSLPNIRSVRVGS